MLCGYFMGGENVFIECFTLNGKPYLRLARSVRITKEDGRKVIQKQPVYNIGPLSRYDDGQPDYVRRLRDSFRRGSPIIPELLPFVGEVPVEKTTIEFVTGDIYCAANPKRFAACLLDAVFSALGLVFTLL